MFLLKNCCFPKADFCLVFGFAGALTFYLWDSYQQGAFKICAVMRYKQELKFLIESTYSLWKAHPVPRTEAEKIGKRAKIIYVFSSVYIANVAVLGWILIIKQLFMNELPLSGYLPPNVPYLFGLMAFVQATWTTFIIPFGLGADILCVALCSNLESQYDILMVDVRNILEENQAEHLDEDVLIRFKRLINRHNFLLM